MRFLLGFLLGYFIRGKRKSRSPFAHIFAATRGSHFTAVSNRFRFRNALNHLKSFLAFSHSYRSATIGSTLVARLAPM
jgi:hypothetical protein